MTTPATVPRVVVQRHWQCAVSACDHWDIAQTWDPRQGKEVLDVCFKDYDRRILKDDKQEMQDQLETLHHLHHLIATKFVHGVIVPNGHSAVLSPLRLANLHPYWDATSTCSYTLAFIWHSPCGSSETSCFVAIPHQSFTAGTLETLGAMRTLPHQALWKGASLWCASSWPAMAM